MPYAIAAAVKNYIFGYGSLVSPESITLTLRRQFSPGELKLAEVKNHTRLWGLVCPVILHGPDGDKPVNAVFLDVRRSPGKCVNGVLIEVTEQEMQSLDIRERQYERVEITNDTVPALEGDDDDDDDDNRSRVFTYTGRMVYFVENYKNPKVLDEYQKKVLAGLHYWGSDFIEKFNQTTVPHNYEIVSGSYRFLDDEQNRLTGHS